MVETNGALGGLTETGTQQMTEPTDVFLDAIESNRRYMIWLVGQGHPSEKY